MKIVTILMLVAACGGERATPPPPPNALGTLICEPQIDVVATGAADPDRIEATKALEREVADRVTDDAFLRRVALAEHLDATAVAHVTARPVKDARLVEVAVALPDPGLALRVCNAVLEHYVDERLGGGDPLAPARTDVRILDRCSRSR
jgi:hypothetical protein